MVESSIINEERVNQGLLALQGNSVHKSILLLLIIPLISFSLKAENDVATKNYNENIVSKAAELKTIKLELAEGVAIDYKLPEGSAKSLVNTIQEAPHWKNEDGTWKNLTKQFLNCTWNEKDYLRKAGKNFNRTQIPM